MKRNIYNNVKFIEKLSQMRRYTIGLKGGGEWKAFRKMLPNFKNKRVLDLGCGFGLHCQYVFEHGARYIIGVDISEKMLSIAKEKTAEEIKYICQPIESVKFPKNSFDVIISSLAFHYVKSFENIVKNVFRWLADDGEFIFLVEHPIFTSSGLREFYRDSKGNILHFPVDNYFYEGRRESIFLGEKVLKYHKTLTTYLNTLIQHGFEVTGVIEPQPPKNMLKSIKNMKDELRRPMMLIISARKKHFPYWKRLKSL